MSDITENIKNNYKPVWEGETKLGIKKKIFAILGNISGDLFTKLIDKNGIYIKDKNGKQIYVRKSSLFNFSERSKSQNKDENI